MRILLTNNLYTLLIIFLLYGIEDYFLITTLELKDTNIKVGYEVKKYENKFLYLLYVLYLKFKFRYFLNDGLVIGNGHLLYSKSVIGKKRFIMIEDGTRNYITISETKSSKIKSFLGYLNQNEEMERAEKIILTKRLDEKNFNKKIEVLNIKKRWQELSILEQEKIIDIFLGDDFSRELLNKCKFILFTQPLSEDNIVSEQEKVELYKKIIEKYDTNFLYIKPHPREKTKYDKIFPNIKVLKKSFPVELLVLMELPIEKVITIFSTGVCIFLDKCEIDFYGTEINDKFFKKFGSMNHIIKRNRNL